MAGGGAMGRVTGNEDRNGTSGGGALVSFEGMADGRHEGGGKSGMTPRFWLEQLNGCWHRLQDGANWKRARLGGEMKSSTMTLTVR